LTPSRGCILLNPVHNRPEPPPPESPPQRRNLAAGVVLGYQLTAGMLIFTLIGYWIGGKTGATQTGTLAGMFMGLLYGGYEVWKLVRQLK
jgi:hypothetical protein